MMTIDIGHGLRDGIGTAACAYRTRLLAGAGATEIKVATTGRLTFTIGGARRCYKVTLPQNYSESEAFEIAGTTDSPLCRALRDLGVAP